jgi:uncharacterized protein YecE (DUF72 family)
MLPHRSPDGGAGISRSGIGYRATGHIASVAEIRIGISGWQYAGWRGDFYPPGLPQRRQLEYVAERMRTVEINGSFYSLQRPESYLSWVRQTPDDFVFAVKGGRFITHMKKLGGVETPLANFLASGVLALGAKLGPLLWQLPPNLGFNPARLAAFFVLLPRATAEAAVLAQHHDERLDGRAWTTTDVTLPLRHALEVRHDSFRTQEFVDLARQHDIAVVTADTAGKWPMIYDQTSDFAYVRLHGDEELYVSGYTEKALDMWATRILEWHEHGRRDVFVYFDNDVKVRAPYDAMALAERVGSVVAKQR